MPITRRITRQRNGHQHQAVARRRIGNRHRDPTLMRRIINYPGIEDIGAAQAPPKTIQRNGADHSSAAVLDAHLTAQRHHQMIRPHRPLSIWIERHGIIQQAREARGNRRRRRRARCRQQRPGRLHDRRTFRHLSGLLCNSWLRGPAPAAKGSLGADSGARLALREFREVHGLSVQRPPGFSLPPRAGRRIRRDADGAAQPARYQHH